MAFGRIEQIEMCAITCWIHPTMNSAAVPRYNWHESYDWNYEHAPAPPSVEEPNAAGRWDFCSLPVTSPLGIAAGPLLNGRWILYYAAWGFDVLTYKTVRSRFRACYPTPNLQPVVSAALQRGDAVLPASADMNGSWAVSFGMPSKAPELWRADVEATRRSLPRHKILSVSVVATPEPHWTRDDLAADFARCAKWAVNSGADCVEANFSCPNVSSADGQIFQQPEIAAAVAGRLREAVGRKPLLLKIGHVPDEALATDLCRAVAPHADALVMVNCISAAVMDAAGGPMFDGQKRGIAGHAIRDAALDQVHLFARVIRREELRLRLVGVGGLAAAADVQAHIEAGAHAVQLATSAMLDPTVGLKIRTALR
jgi:dihydroorotate dehydrogenase (NAD+) catalytic subunit